MEKQEISTKKLGAILCHNRGYEIIDNKVLFNGRERKLDIRCKKNNGQSSYSSFGIKNDEGKRIQVFVHHLMAYKKYGQLFIDGLDGEEIIVIHLDGNTLNNSYDNIFLGNRSHARRQREGEKLESKIFLRYIHNLQISEGHQQ
jgi:hypothetical protein